jgi:hypothetical protein
MKSRQPLWRLGLSGDQPLEHVVILGSGASAAVTEGTDEPFPTDPYFLKRLNEHRDHPYLNPCIIKLALNYLRHGGKDWENQSFEEAWTSIDEAYNDVTELLALEIRSKFAELRAGAARREHERGLGFYYSVRQGNPTSTELLINAGWECMQALLALLGRLPDKTDLERFFGKLPYLKDTPTRCAVISFNYDLAFETGCNNTNIHLIDYPLAADCGKDRGICIIKPHGSVNWVQRIDTVGGTTESIIHRSEALALNEIGYEAPRHRYLAQPMLVGLRPKHEHDERSSDRCTVDLFRKIREACATSLASAREISIVGYRFPPADRYFRRVLMEASGSRERPLARVNYIGKDGDEAYWKNLLSHLFWVRSRADVKVNLDRF